jgi:hypothetical protein
MSRSRGNKIKSLRSNPYQDPNVFYMSLEEAKDLIASRFEFESLAERHEDKRLKRMRPSQG